MIAHKEVGMDPDNWLRLKSIDAALINGMVPVRLLPFTSNTTSTGKLPNEDGIVPIDLVEPHS